MTRPLAALALLVLAACGGGEKSALSSISREPVSVRGWILDVKGAQHADNADMEIARRTQLFLSSSVWVENTEYASGGIAENGAFVVLDVPPNNAILGFNAPGAETAKIVLEGVPGNADVLIPNVILQPNGATVYDPKQIQIRIPVDIDKARDSGRTAKVAGYTVRIIETPYNELMNRREYPVPPGFRPVATVR
jgi:hypothetical protein